MRDHPQHNIEVPAGMWGVKLRKEHIRNLYEASFGKLLSSISSKRGYLLAFAPRARLNPDQIALKHLFWYVIKIDFVLSRFCVNTHCNLIKPQIIIIRSLFYFTGHGQEKWQWRMTRIFVIRLILRRNRDLWCLFQPNGNRVLGTTLEL